VTSKDDDGSIFSVEMILHNYKFSRVSSPLNLPCGMTIELSFAKFIERNLYSFALLACGT